MTRDEAVAKVAFRLGNLTGYDDEILADMKLALQELEMDTELPWFLATSDATLQNSGETIDLPSNWLDFEDAQPVLWLQDSDGNLSKEIVRTTYRKIVEARGQYAVTQRSGTPGFFDIRGSKIYLGPLIPSTTETFTLWYMGASTSLATNVSDNAWLVNAPEVLINAAGIKTAMAMRDTDAVAIFQAGLASAHEILWRKNAARQVAGANLRMEYK